MRHTETHFGLCRDDHGNISADGGETCLDTPLSDDHWHELVRDIEGYWDRAMTEQELSDLAELVR